MPGCRGPSRARCRSPRSGHSPAGPAIEPMLPVGVLDVRRHVARGPLPDRAFKQPLLFGEIEADHTELQIVT